MDLVWKPLGDVSYASAKNRTSKAAIGTAYWVQRETKCSLYVKVRDDRWLCFGARTVTACLAQYLKKPGAGAPSNDHNIANGITGHLSLQVTQLETKPPRPEPSLALTPTDIWRALEQRGADVIWRPVTTPKELHNAEVTLGFLFPPSYVELVTESGAPALGDGDTFAVLTPKQVVRFTQELRTLEPEMFESPESFERVRAQLSNAVLFQFGRDAGEGYVFLTDTASADGEMHIGDFSHDYLEELDWRPKSKAVFRSLLASTRHAAEQIQRDLPQ